MAAMTAVALVVVSGCSLFGDGTPRTSTTTVAASTPASTAPTTTVEATTVVPAAARITDLPDIGPESDPDLVRVAQRLVTLWGYRAAVDGDFGPQTMARIASLREALGLETGDRIDAAVWEAVFLEDSLASGPLDVSALDATGALGGLPVPEVSLLLSETGAQADRVEHYTMAYHADSAAVAAWVRDRLDTDTLSDWTICGEQPVTGDDLVTITGVDATRAFSYTVTAAGSGRVDLFLSVVSDVVGECP
jgi:peptidoglycan hydrolase-like protein with peptidoglycan-binding domain